MRKQFWLFLIITGNLLAACSNSSVVGLTEGVIFQSVDEIIEQPLEITNFANNGSATLPIHTTVPVACSLVYGTTPEFGSLTLDQDMAGGTHSNHNPLLQGITEAYTPSGGPMRPVPAGTWSMFASTPASRSIRLMESSSAS